jgi:GNAT superfamily N-acetyltransferase
LKETPRALDAYRLYESLGPARSIDAVARQLDKSRQLIGRWSAAHGWVERVAAYDAQVAAEAEARAREERLAEIERARKQRLQVARAARGKGVEALAAMSAQQLAHLPSGTVRLLEYADRTERLDLGEAEQRVEVSGPEGSAIIFEVRHVSRGDRGSGDDQG